MASYAFKKKSNQLIFIFFLNHDKTHCMIASNKLLGEHWSHKCCYSGSGSRQGGSASSGAAQKPELGQYVLCI